MNDERFDFSCLDPTKDGLRWNGRIVAIADAACAHYRRKLTISGQLLLWARPMLAIAAGLALLGWTSLIAMGAPTEKASFELTANDRSLVVADWVVRNEIPSPELVISVFGRASGEQ